VWNEKRKIKQNKYDKQNKEQSQRKKNTMQLCECYYYINCRSIHLYLHSINKKENDESKV